jgi:hypothetical protein
VNGIHDDEAGEEPRHPTRGVFFEVRPGNLHAG